MGRARVGNGQCEDEAKEEGEPGAPAFLCSMVIINDSWK